MKYLSEEEIENPNIEPSKGRKANKRLKSKYEIGANKIKKQNNTEINENINFENKKVKFKCDNIIKKEIKPQKIKPPKSMNKNGITKKKKNDKIKSKNKNKNKNKK